MNFFIGLICVGVGSIYTFFGYVLSSILLPFLAFFVGLMVVFLALGGGIINTAIGLAIGAGVAWLAFFFPSARMIVAGVSIGLSLFTTLMAALGFRTEVIVIVLMGASVILAVVALLPFLRKYIIIGATALVGASLMTTGILFFIPELIPVGSGISVGDVLVAFHQLPLIVLGVWVPITALSIWFQYRIVKGRRGLEEDEA